MKNGPANQFWRINERIQARELRVIGSDGKQIGVITRDEALRQAREQELDLVEIAPHAKPPVAKIIDFTKFKYEQDKKQREERKKEKKGSAVKEIWFRPLIADGDYQTRLARVTEFLGEGAKVRVTIKPKRRIDNNSPLYRVLERVITDTAEIARVEQEPKMFGKQLVTLLVPYKAKKTAETEISEEGDHEETEKNETQTQEVDSSKV